MWMLVPAGAVLCAARAVERLLACVCVLLVECSVLWRSGRLDTGGPAGR